MSLFMCTKNYLILEHGSPKSPHSCKDKVEFVVFLRAVRWSVIRGQEDLQQVAEHLEHAHFLHRSYLLEAMLECLQTRRNITLKENGEVGLFGLDFTLVNPALNVAGERMGANVYGSNMPVHAP